MLQPAHTLGTTKVLPGYYREALAAGMLFCCLAFSCVRFLFRNVSSQSEFNFDVSHPEEGYTQWLTGRRVAAEELARRIFLPLGHDVEIWLYGGIRLRGNLRLREDLLFIDEERVRHLELAVDRVPFTLRDMESCVRLD